MENLNDLIEEVYLAGMSKDRWGLFLEKCSVFFDGSAANVSIYDNTEIKMKLDEVFNIPLEGRELYLDERLQVDERFDHALRNRHLKITYDYQHIDENRIDKSPHYSFLRKWGDYRYYMARICYGDDRRLPVFNVQRGRNQGHATRKDIEQFELISSHAIRALQIGWRIQSLQRETHVYQRSLDHHIDAVFWLGSDARVIGMNLQAEKLMSSGTSLQLSGGTLRARTPAETRELYLAIRNACELSSGASVEVTSNIAISQGQSGSKLVLSILPIKASALEVEPAEARVVIFVRDPSTIRIDPHKLERLLDLTRAESKLAAFLADGNSVTEYAEHCGTGISTVRWHLRNIFQKTQTTNQASLVALVHRYCAG